MPFSNRASDRHPFQGSRTCLAVNPYPQPAPCRKSMLIPPNCSSKNSNHVWEKKREIERNKMELTYLCGMLYIMCTKQVSKVFKMEISKILRPYDMFLEHSVGSSNTYIRNSLFCYFRLAAVYFSTFPTCDQRKITQASEFNSTAWSKWQGACLPACTVFTRLCARLVRGCAPWDKRGTFPNSH